MFPILWIFLQNAAAHIWYLALHLESGSFPRPLSPAQEQEAFAAMGNGDTTARDRLISHNLRLVAHVAKKYYAAPSSQDDFISIGTIGLIKAVDTFRPERQVRFASYASQCIENEIRMYLRHTKRQAPTVSLQEPLEGSSNDSGMLTLADVLPDLARMEDGCERKDAAKRIFSLISTLPTREAAVLRLRYGLDGNTPLTQQQTAERFGISRSYVSRIEKRALESLSRRFRSDE